MVIRICFRAENTITSIDVATLYEAILLMKKVGEDDLISVTKVVMP